MEIVNMSAQIRHGIRGAEEKLCRRRAQGHDDLGAHHENLPHQERTAGIALVTLRSPILRRTALHHIADVNVFATNAHGSDHVVEQLSGAADERLSLRIFIRARTLAYEHDSRVRITHPEDDVGASLAQHTARTIAQVFTNHAESSRSVVEDGRKLRGICREFDGWEFDAAEFVHAERFRSLRFSNN